MISDQHRLIIEDLRKITKPAFQSYGKGDFSEATRLVEALIDTRETGSGDLEADEVAACYLGFLRLVFANARDGRWDEALLESTISRLRQVMQTKLGNNQRITALLQLRVMSGNATGNSMDREEFSELLNSGYLLERSSNLWDSVALWAFENSQMDVLEEAFENQTINPGSMMPQESWQRINLMFQLRRGVANRRDIEEYIKLMRMVPQIEEFRIAILPTVRKLGLWDDELEGRMNEMLEKARSTDYDFRVERRTGRIRS